MRTFLLLTLAILAADALGQEAKSTATPSAATAPPTRQPAGPVVELKAPEISVGIIGADQKL